MAIDRLLVANRGEIAVRVIRAARELDIATVAVAPSDDAHGLHHRLADTSLLLSGEGPAAYLDVEGIVEVALESECDALHPGYGFLAESPALAKACVDAGIVFVGPTVEQLERFGSKLSARALAAKVGVPLAPGTGLETTLSDAAALFDAHGAIMIKAVAGGGGRGIRAVRPGDDLASAWARAESEAAASFGDRDLYAEALIEPARHIEVQIVGDGTRVIHLGERECTLQRRNQKLVEVAPSPSISDAARSGMTDAALAMAQHLEPYRSLGTWEFLVDRDDPSRFFFLEVNPRIQVEHTVTEMVAGVDLVQAQLLLAGGASLADVGLAHASDRSAQGFAVQARVNTETMSTDATVIPASGALGAFGLPSGPGVRTDTAGYVGYSPHPAFDSLLAKVVAHAPAGTYAGALTKLRGALGEFEIQGVATNVGFLQALLSHPDVIANRLSTSWIGDHTDELLASTEFAPSAGLPPTDEGFRSSVTDGSDEMSIVAPLAGTVVAVPVAAGDKIAVGTMVAVIEAMKMEHEVRAIGPGTVTAVDVAVGQTVQASDRLVGLLSADGGADEVATEEEIDLNAIRPDLAELFERRSFGLDENRPDAVEKRHKRGHRTARANIADLIDEGTFVEYGGLALAAQRRRRDLQDLLTNTTGDGMVGGIASINGDLFDSDLTQAIVVSYDYMVMAGTQGLQNHRKKDRLFELAEQNRLPVVLYAEGGGGRPGDTDSVGGSGLDCLAFAMFAELSGLVPLIGVVNGRCFAGNAVLLGCCDVIISTQGASIGVGGPAMIEGGGLGVFSPEEVGPTDVQYPNGVIDVLVADEAAATEKAKQYLSYFQGSVAAWEMHDQRQLRHLVPENRKRAYAMRPVIETLCDVGSVLELRAGWGHGMITALARIEGRPVGVLANNPQHLAGAIDADAADKGARFMQLCDAHDLPLVFLCDTPGIMVGPDAERQATVRHAARMFLTAASVDIPVMTIVTRKGYGLGAQAMAAGSFKRTMFTVAWPTGEFGGMGLEGFVRLGYRKELEAIDDPVARQAEFEERVARLHQHGKAVNAASVFEIDDVIDPVESRRRISTALRAASSPRTKVRREPKRPMIDSW